MINMHPSLLGDFTIFGFTKNPKTFLDEEIPSRLGIIPNRIDIGTAGSIFFFTSYGDWTETDDSITIVLGLVKSPCHSRLKSQDLIRQRIAIPNGIESNRIWGNATVICLSKIEPRIAAFLTLLSVSQLFYSQLDDGFLCADNLKGLVSLLGHPAVNEEAIPMHFLFRLIPGKSTYFKNIYSICPGEMITWYDGVLRTKLVKNLDSLIQDTGSKLSESKASRILFEHLEDAIITYIPDLKTAGKFANLLSGGIDSSVIQLALKKLGVHPLRSFSYTISTPEFEAERRYVDQARQLLKTDHVNIDIKPDNYLDLLVRTIDTVFHPSLCVETDPCFLALVEYLDTNAPDIRFCFAGHGADALFGSSFVNKILLLEFSRIFPGARWLLRVLGKFVRPFSPVKSDGLQVVADILPNFREKNSFHNPLNMMNIYTDMNYARRCFGDKVLFTALEYRRDFVAAYRDSANLMEQVQTIELLTWDYEAAIFSQQLFLAHRKHLLFPFLEQDILSVAYAIKPFNRYIKGIQVKPILKQILKHDLMSGIAENPKRGGTFEDDLFTWMRQGILKERVRSIKRPGFLSANDFQQLVDHPTPFLWELLLFDIFQERIIDAHNKIT
jgi:asparagine synthetase B (glutamine-hydrolysing)